MLQDIPREDQIVCVSMLSKEGHQVGFVHFGDAQRPRSLDQLGTDVDTLSVGVAQLVKPPDCSSIATACVDNDSSLVLGEKPAKRLLQAKGGLLEVTGTDLAFARLEVRTLVIPKETILIGHRQLGIASPRFFVSCERF